MTVYVRIVWLKFFKFFLFCFHFLPKNLIFLLNKSLDFIKLIFKLIISNFFFTLLWKAWSFRFWHFWLLIKFIKFILFFSNHSLQFFYLLLNNWIFFSQLFYFHLLSCQHFRKSSVLWICMKALFKHWNFWSKVFIFF